MNEFPDQILGGELRLSQRFAGRAAAGFARRDEQSSAWYTKGGLNNPIDHVGVFVADDPGLALSATENVAGSSLLSTVGEAIYHDGMWELGPGEAQFQPDPRVVLHWERSKYHSVTCSAAIGTVAVRATKRALTAAELLQAVQEVVLKLSENRS